jgi:hypothetical protein
MGAFSDLQLTSNDADPELHGFFQRDGDGEVGHPTIPRFLVSLRFPVAVFDLVHV